MKTKLIGFCILFTTVASAQSSAVTITDLKPKHSGNKFPEVHCISKPEVAKKINTFLQLDYLEHLPGVFKKHPFELVSYDRPHREMGGCKGFESWKKEQTPKNILSITLEVDFTGAYTEESKVHHNYDLRTGNSMPIVSLIKKEKRTPLANLLNAKAKKGIDDFLTTAKNELTEIDSIQNREGFDDANAQIAMYTNCIDDAYPYTLEEYSFYFVKDSIHFIRDRCSAHVNRALDDLWEFDFRFSYAQMEPYFSDYSKSLLSSDSAKHLDDGFPQGKIYKGKIGSYPITILIQEISNDGSLELFYWYDKKKLPITWSGNYHNHHFSLKEEIETKESFETLANIEADWKNNKITGTWTNPKTKKTYKLEATEY